MAASWERSSAEWKKFELGDGAGVFFYCPLSQQLRLTPALVAPRLGRWGGGSAVSGLGSGSGSALGLSGSRAGGAGSYRGPGNTRGSPDVGFHRNPSGDPVAGVSTESGPDPPDSVFGLGARAGWGFPADPEMPSAVGAGFVRGTIGGGVWSGLVQVWAVEGFLQYQLELIIAEQSLQLWEPIQASVHLRQLQ